MEQRFSKGTEEQMMFNDYLMLCQKMWIPEADDSYWNQLITSANEFCEKYKSKLAQDLSVALINELERKHKEKNSK